MDGLVERGIELSIYLQDVDSQIATESGFADHWGGEGGED